MTIQSTIHATHKEKSPLLNAANPRDLLPVSLTTFNTRTLYKRPGRSPGSMSKPLIDPACSTSTKTH